MSTTTKTRRPYTTTVTDHSSLSAAITAGERVIADASLAPTTIVSAALFAGAQVVVWVTGPGETAPNMPSVRAIDSVTALATDALYDFGNEAVVVLDRASLNPFGNPADRFALLDGAPQAASTIRRAI